MLKSFGGSGKEYNSEWHEKRREAREETFGIDEWGPIEIAQYDLEGVEFTRKKKKSTYELEPLRTDAEGSAQDVADLRTIASIRD
jgi:hypothetical protein